LSVKALEQFSLLSLVKWRWRRRNSSSWTYEGSKHHEQTKAV